MNTFNRIKNVLFAAWPSLSENPSLRRWLDIGFLVICANILLFAFVRQAIRVLDLIFSYSSYWPTLLVYSVVLLGFTVIGLSLIRLGGLQERINLSILFRYPPIWAIGIIGTILFCSIVFIFESNTKDSWALYPESHFIPIVFSAIFGVLISVFYNAITSTNQAHATGHALKTAQESEGLLALAEDKKAFLDWLLVEKPISTPREDLFEHKIHAKRIATVLSQDIASSIGILGPYGTGKSSLINLIQYYLEQNTVTGFKGEIITCKVDGWGRVSGTVAHKILSISVEEVKKHVDCLSIVALPENYRQAIGESKTPLGAVVSALLNASHDPVSQLRKLDNILAAARLRLVIFLEDLDRNVSDEIIQTEMPALLDRLRSLKHVSFVLAIGTERRFSDILIRICDHVEAIA